MYLPIAPGTGQHGRAQAVGRMALARPRRNYRVAQEAEFVYMAAAFMATTQTPKYRKLRPGVCPDSGRDKVQLRRRGSENHARATIIPVSRSVCVCVWNPAGAKLRGYRHIAPVVSLRASKYKGGNFHTEGAVGKAPGEVMDANSDLTFPSPLCSPWHSVSEAGDRAGEIWC